MSRIRDNYDESLWNRLVRWVNGETDPFKGKLEMKPLREAELKGDSVYNPDQLDKARIEEQLNDLSRNKEMKAFRML